MSVCVCGNVVFDMLVRPVEQLRWAATTLVETVSQQLGGNAGSTSYTLAKLGIPTFVVTLAGRDSAAEAVIARMQSAGVDTSRLMRTDAPTSVADIARQPFGRACAALLSGSGSGAVPLISDLRRDAFPSGGGFPHESFADGGAGSPEKRERTRDDDQRRYAMGHRRTNG